MPLYRELNIHNGCFRVAFKSCKSIFYKRAINIITSSPDNWEFNLTIYGEKSRVNGLVSIKTRKHTITFTVINSDLYGKRRYVTEYTPEIREYLVDYFQVLYGSTI